jgi:hypothetical protein
VAEAKPELSVLSSQMPLLEGSAHRVLELVHLDGLQQIVERSVLEASYGSLDRAVGGDHDGPYLGIEPQDLPQQLVTIHGGHPQVGDDHVRVVPSGHLQAPGAVLGLVHLGAEIAQDSGEHLSLRRVVFDDQDPSFEAHQWLLRVEGTRTMASTPLVVRLRSST